MYVCGGGGGGEWERGGREKRENDVLKPTTSLYWWYQRKIDKKHGHSFYSIQSWWIYWDLTAADARAKCCAKSE